MECTTQPLLPSPQYHSWRRGLQTEADPTLAPGTSAGLPRLTLLTDSLLEVHVSLLPAFLLLGTAQGW